MLADRISGLKMDKPLTRHPQVARQAAKLTLGVWIFTFFLFLMPVVAATGHLPRFAFGAMGIDIAFGMALSLPIYWVAARLEYAGTAWKVGGVVLAVCFAAFAFALFDAVRGGHII